ncbi:DNA polymerase B 2 [Rhizophagus diaphanus]|nr:plasmid-related DNA polymerase [Glomus sp. DAOM 229456]RGB22182.1 DNA polymerase B 2 [Rhizophagus diaphanus] [Rhizophagus sp. MUCL 43196]
MDVSKQYIMGDCISLHQILTSFFNTLNEEFPIDPLQVLSAPSAAFKIWRAQQLPLLHQDKLIVHDFSHTLFDTYFRNGYNGGIVDVYRPHLTGKVGYYYDVNSLYPTAMCRPMPVGTPRLLEPNLYSTSFFGFIDATVQSPNNEYIGLLSIKYEGKLICPAGIFRGLFFSEELNFALENGYRIIKINTLYSFQKGENCFLDLIEKLNDMKVTAQLNNQPTIRNVAKLLMNSMYGRFGMHTKPMQTSLIPDHLLEQYSKVFQIHSNIDFNQFLLIHYSLLPSEELGNKPNRRLIRKFQNSLPSRTNVAIASAVTAYSRMIINQHKLTAINTGLKLYYSDTDSLVVDGKLPDHLLDNAKLGLLKLEYEIKEGIFPMPKVYFLETMDGKIVTKCKGFPGKLDRSAYLSLLQGKTITGLSVNKWYRSLRDSSVQIRRELPYEMRFSFNKRQQVFNNERWEDTKPLLFKPTIQS